MQAWTILKLLEWTADFFEKKGVPNPRLDAELLLAECLGCQRIDLYTSFSKPVELDELDRFRPWVERRANREPLQYILGYTEFYGHRIHVNREVLIPRPETECLVDEVLQVGAAYEADGTQWGLLELGVGSGCIAVALAKQLKKLSITATEQSPTALITAQGNVNFHKLRERIELFKADLFPEFLGEGAKFPYPVIVSNPPYIPSDQLPTLQPEVSQFEPEMALDGGSDGLDVYRRIAEGLEQWLAPAGTFIGEIGEDQSKAIQNLFETQAWCDTVDIKCDLNKNPRIVVAKRHS